MSLGTEVGLGPGDVVLDGDPGAPKKGHSPPVIGLYCDQTAGWIKTPLGKEVDLGPGHIVLDGDPASPSQKEHSSFPLFWPMSIVATVAHLSYC